MPGRNFLTRFWDEQCCMFLDKLGAIRRKPSRDAVHDARVAVKKLSSILQLTASGDPGDERKAVFRPIKLFFRTAGLYRDADMSLHLTRIIVRQQQLLLPSFQYHLRAIRSVAGINTKLAAQLPLESALSETGNLLLKEWDTCTDEELKQFVEEKSYRKEAECRDLSKDLEKQAHQVRKELKKLYYWLVPCPMNTLFDEKQMKKFRHCLEALGQWHDHDVLYAWLCKFRKQWLIKGTSEYEQMMKTEQVTRLMREEWLSGSGDRIKKLLGD